MLDDIIELITPMANIEHLMLSSCKCYENAIECVSEAVATDEDAKSELLRRLGNVRNELGLKYMFWAQGKHANIQFFFLINYLHLIFFRGICKRYGEKIK